MRSPEKSSMETHLEFAKWVTEQKQAFRLQDVCVALDVGMNTAHRYVTAAVAVSLVRVFKDPKRSNRNLYEPI
jgi:hypothetical protein